MTIFQIYDLDVIFPYQSMYPEQKEFMGQLKLSFDANGSSILELPSGCGKNITVFSLVLSYLAEHPNIGPLVYCVSSKASLYRAIRDLEIVHKARVLKSNHEFDTKFHAVPFLSRELSCLNPNALTSPSIPIFCAQSTFPWSESKCPFYENTPDSLPEGVISIEDLHTFCQKNHSCPYYTARRLCKQANVIICSTEELVHPRGGLYLRKILPTNSIIVFEDANTIDDICCNSMSYCISKSCIEEAGNAAKLARKVLSRAKEHEQDLIQKAYKRLKDGLKIPDVEQIIPESIDIFKHPVIEEHRSIRPIPGSLRNSDVLIARIINFIQYLLQIFTNTDDFIFTSAQMLAEIAEIVFIEPEMLHFMTTAFSFFLMSLKVDLIENYIPLFVVLDFAAIISTYEDNISIFYDTHNPNNRDSEDEKYRTLQVVCLDASLAFSQILPFKRIVLTGETISPLSMYSQILNFEPTSIVDYTISSSRVNVLPIVVARGTDQTLLSSALDLSKNLNGINNYGRLISDIVKVVPDGIIGFFPSFPFMHEILEMWHQTGVLKSILDYKPLFIEYQNPVKTSMIIDNYKRAVENGRGGVFFGVSSGFASGEIDFSGPSGRCVILFGVPEPQKTSSIIKSRSEFLDKQFQISKEIFQIFNSMRIASRCFSKVLSSKNDYALVLLADPRYEKEDYMTSLSSWIRKNISNNSINQSVDDAIEQAKGFYLKMSQPFKHTKDSIILNGFQSWCKMYDLKFTTDELRDFISFLKDKEEFKRVPIDQSVFKNSDSMEKWFTNNWALFDQCLTKCHTEWQTIKKKAKEIQIQNI